MVRQRGGLDSSDTSTIIGLVIFLIIAGLAIGLGVYFGTKKNDTSSTPPSYHLPGQQTHLPGNSGKICPTSITVANTRVVNPASTTPSLVVDFTITPSQMIDGSVDGNFSDSGGPWITSTADGRNGTMTFNFGSALTPGWHNGTVELTYGDSSGCRLTTSQPVSFFA